MELHEALTQIAEIRLQLARTEIFRGYRAAPVALSGLLAFAAAITQALTLPSPTEQLASYLVLWVGVAAISGLATLFDIWSRHRRSPLTLRKEITWLACEQFLPCVIAGAALTAVIAFQAPEVAWMLPGLWSILLSLGMFASFRLLPRPVFWVATYYLCAGLVCLACCHGASACSPWAMALPFGGGQLAAAAVLHWTSEPEDV